MKKSKHKSAKASSKESYREKGYLQTLDLKEWWEEFVDSFRKNGTNKYPTVWSFIKVKAKFAWQRDFLYWLLGPVASEGNPKFNFPQYDWESKRENGFWYSSKNIENLKAEIKRKDNSFARLQTAGESLLEDLAELTELTKQVSKEFGGRLLLPNASTAENTARAQLFFQLKEKIQGMKAHILQTYAKTQGMDLNQLANFLELFAGGMGQAAAQQLGYGGGKFLESGKSKEGDQYHQVLTQLVDMTMNKAAELNLDVPSSEMEKVIKESSPKKVKVIQ